MIGPRVAEEAGLVRREQMPFHCLAYRGYVSTQPTQVASLASDKHHLISMNL